MRKTVAFSRFRKKRGFMEHRATSQFWQHYHALQPHIRSSADKQFSFSLLKGNPEHRSLQFKKIGDRRGKEIYSARVTLSHRALAFKRPNGFLWFWIGAAALLLVLLVMEGCSSSSSSGSPSSASCDDPQIDLCRRLQNSSTPPAAPGGPLEGKSPEEMKNILQHCVELKNRGCL